MTAVEWLIQQIDNEDMGEIPMWVYDFCYNALELEKEQHSETWNAAIQAHENRGFVISRSLCDFDDYFDKLKKDNQ